MKRKNKAGRKRAPLQQSILKEVLARHRAGNLQQAEFLYKKISPSVITYRWSGLNNPPKQYA
jgi:hypothetical protein